MATAKWWRDDEHRAALVGALEAIAEALDVPRNRFGALQVDYVKQEPLRLLAVKYDVGGSTDIAHQALQVARAALRAAGVQP